MGSRQIVRKRRRSKKDMERRTAKAFHLTQVGELSSARHVLESSPVAPGNQENSDGRGSKAKQAKI